MKELPKFVLISIVIGFITMPVSNIIGLSTNTYAINAPRNFLGLPRITSIIVVQTGYSKIQDAIEAAKAGDTIKVLPGTYTEQLSIQKNINLIGSGAISTIIKAPAMLQPGITGNPNIIEVSKGATVTMKDFTVSGTSVSNCGTSIGNGLVGVSAIEDATINIDNFALRDCTFDAFRVGAPSFISNGPQVGHATITRTDIGDYQFSGIEAFADASTLTITMSKVNAAENAIILSPAGVVSVDGAKSIITQNKITGNICSLSLCGPDYVNEFQGFGILLDSSAPGTIVSHNQVLNNDAGIGVVEGSGCCKIANNVLDNNQFFGIVIQDSKQTSSTDKISGGRVGVAAISLETDTVTKLVNDKIKNTEIPLQEIECDDATAKIIVIPSKSIQPDRPGC